MKFYNREKELAVLEATRKASMKHSRMTVLTGRRRIGKTRLIRHSLKGERYLYFFIARKDEKLLCEEFCEQIQDVLQIPIFGTISSFKELFNMLMKYAADHPVHVVIDEFQEFERVNPSVFSDLQNIWDSDKLKTKMHLILSGSVYSMMRQIFENAEEPLFGRANERLLIQPFSIDIQREILQEINPDFAAMDLLTFYMITGGVPKYAEQLMDKNRGTKEEILQEIVSENSIFLDEGRNVLIEEFGKEYGNYFSILSLLATGKTTRGEIENMLGRDIGGYLSRLETDYQIIQRSIPIFSKPGTRNIRYFIRDNFLNFWFRFLYKYQAAVEIGNFNYLHQVIDRDFHTFSGLFLERLIKEKLALSESYSEIGSYWEKGNRNEIDIVAINDLEKIALIAEVKLQKKHISLDKLRVKAADLMRKLGGYEVTYRGFSLEDI